MRSAGAPFASARPPELTPPAAHRPPLRLRPWMVLVAVLLAVAVGGAATAVVKVSGQDRPGPGRAATGPCAGKPHLRVVAAPELVPVLRTAAEAVAPMVDGCAPIAVTPQEPADTAGQRDQAADYDAWIPSSSLWLRQADADRLGFPATGTSLARSPVVVAMPQEYAQKLGWPAKQPAWAELAALTYSRQIPKFSMSDAQRDTTGMLATMAVYTAIGRTTPDNGIAQLRSLTFRSRLADAAADTNALLDKMAAESSTDNAVRNVGLFPVREQALWQYSRRQHTLELVGAYPRDAIVEADYPMAVRAEAAEDRTLRGLADKLTGWFTTDAGLTALANQGFRGPAGRDAGVAPAGPGFVPRYPPPTALPQDAAAVRAAVRQWALYKRLVFQVLVLVDASGSMNAPARDSAGNVTTKADLLRRSGILAAQLFGEDTSVALWMFGMPEEESPPYVEVVPFGPIDEAVNGVPRRKIFGEAAQNFKALPDAGTPLFESVLRADAEMQRRFQPDAVTLVVVLTDGRDEETKYAMPRDEFLRRLAAARDPAKPVPIHSIGYGGDADMTTLNELSKRTGGQAVASANPADLASAMAKIFLAARQAHG